MLRLPRSARARVAGALLAAASICLLAACGSSGPEASESAEPSTSASATPTDGATETPAEPGPSEEPSEPFAIACETLLTPEQVYAFNPNFGTDPGYDPSAASIVAVVDEGGTACAWLNQTSGEVIEIAVATPAAGALERHGNDAASSLNPVPTYGTPPAVEGYFKRSGSTGTAQVFSGPYWVVLESDALFEPGDAQQLVQSVLANLPTA
ncbi:iron ABC transporter ATP-binding protein [Agromyces sp. CFH 90414]|uniref:Iron ABC transporter ATP-binding protein n=1 Tax=Agromyces agglutinans TaxID=2662258 RepID=A0A6I2F8E6_9MICO|nr:iron ABC transporter ATP-binding protein [Agromyces agglutinans]MRG61725.1 iron ABC transporter ATP-binding protein [Agromyces agglutinans]